ncbi:HAD domain-containing protein [Caballeronia sp. SBC2]|uniref:HAD domain-containing protein n=1 Tax=Caballeronia sp. SBC2 TaxID=2705547 RepID=UPI0013ED71BD|nr:HAD domain-containing protein [Caballeronia sp. SBC2]
MTTPEERTRSSICKLNGGVQVLYVDFDNCLHRCDAYKTAAGLVPSDPSAIFFEFAGVLEELLAPYPAVQIVLSTSWVEALGFEVARDSLSMASLRARVVDSTFNPGRDLPHVWSQTPRGRQIRRHVETFGIKRWLALDDMRDGFEGVESRLVHCQPGVGLGDKDVQALFVGRLEWMFGRRDTSVVAVASPSGRSK